MNRKTFFCFHQQNKVIIETRMKILYLRKKVHDVPPVYRLSQLISTISWVAGSFNKKHTLVIQTVIQQAPQLLCKGIN